MRLFRKLLSPLLLASAVGAFLDLLEYHFEERDIGTFGNFESGPKEILVEKGGDGTWDPRSIFERQCTCPPSAPVNCGPGCCRTGQKCVSHFPQYPVCKLRRLKRSLSSFSARHPVVPTVLQAYAAPVSDAVPTTHTIASGLAIGAARRTPRHAAVIIAGSPVPCAAMAAGTRVSLAPRVADRCAAPKGKRAAKARAAVIAERSAVLVHVRGFL